MLCTSEKFYEATAEEQYDMLYDDGFGQYFTCQMYKGDGSIFPMLKDAVSVFNSDDTSEETKKEKMAGIRAYIEYAIKHKFPAQDVVGSLRIPNFKHDGIDIKKIVMQYLPITERNERNEPLFSEPMHDDDTSVVAQEQTNPVTMTPPIAANAPVVNPAMMPPIAPPVQYNAAAFNTINPNGQPVFQQPTVVAEPVVAEPVQQPAENPGNELTGITKIVMSKVPENGLAISVAGYSNKDVNFIHTVLTTDITVKKNLVNSKIKFLKKHEELDIHSLDMMFYLFNTSNFHQDLITNGVINGINGVRFKEISFNKYIEKDKENYSKSFDIVLAAQTIDQNRPLLVFISTQSSYYDMVKAAVVRL